MTTALRATQPRIGSPVPAPLEIFAPINLPAGVHIPQLAIDRLAAQIANDPKAFAESFLSLLYMAKATDYAVGMQQRAADERAAEHPSLAKVVEQRLGAAIDRIRALESRLDGRNTRGERTERSIEDVRESLSGLIARENV